MKARTIILLVILYFTAMFLMDGTDKSFEKLEPLLLSIGSIIGILVCLWLFYKYKKSGTNFQIPDRFRYLENNDPSKPIDFGIKTVWAAIKADDSYEVSNYIELENPRKSNWIEGMIRAYSGDVFITPQLNGWILIHGFGLPTPDHKDGIGSCVSFLSFLSVKYQDAYIFGNHRVGGVAFWAKSQKGKLKRLYVVADGTGTSIGEESEIELEWNLVDLTVGKETQPEEDLNKYLYPGEDEVIKMAEYWSINPMEISKIKNIEGTGIIGRMNNGL